MHIHDKSGSRRSALRPSKGETSASPNFADLIMHLTGRPCGNSRPLPNSPTLSSALQLVKSSAYMEVVKDKDSIHSHQVFQEADNSLLMGSRTITETSNTCSVKRNFYCHHRHQPMDSRRKAWLTSKNKKNKRRQLASLSIPPSPSFVVSSIPSKGDQSTASRSVL